MKQDSLSLYKSCRLCGHRCGVDRTRGERGLCNMTSSVRVTRAALHMWEEPIISGERGSGTVFFSGCSLGCIYCQNKDISRGAGGVEISEERLSEIFLELECQGAHNVNLVTPTHFVPSVISSVAMARERGLTVPIVYNTSSYETRETITALSGTVDVYLADLKYYKEETARRLSFADGYCRTAREAIAEMVKNQPIPVIKDGIMQRGVVVRILLLPGHLIEAKLSLKYLYDTYGDSIYISLMSQYTPMGELPSPLDRTVTEYEYRSLVRYAEELGVTYAFIQEGGSAEESFIPAFDNTGVLPAGGKN